MFREEAAVKEKDGDLDGGYGDGPEEFECVRDLFPKQSDRFEQLDVTSMTHLDTCANLVQAGCDEMLAVPV